MESPTAYYDLRGPSPVVRAMRSRVDRPPRSPSRIPSPPSTLLAHRQRSSRRGGAAYVPGNRIACRCRRCRRHRQGSAPRRPHLHCLRRGPLCMPACGQGNRGSSHMLTIAAGEDIISRIMAVSEMNGEAIYVLSALGAIKEANLVHSSGVVNHKGPLELLRLGFILAPKNHECVRMTLACADNSVIGGIVTGPLIAATSVQAVVGTFHGDAYWPNMAPRVTTSSANSQFTISNGCSPSSEGCLPKKIEASNEAVRAATVVDLQTTPKDIVVISENAEVLGKDDEVGALHSPVANNGSSVANVKTPEAVKGFVSNSSCRLDSTDAQGRFLQRSDEEPSDRLISSEHSEVALVTSNKIALGAEIPEPELVKGAVCTDTRYYLRKFACVKDGTNAKPGAFLPTREVGTKQIIRQVLEAREGKRLELKRTIACVREQLAALESLLPKRT